MAALVCAATALFAWINVQNAAHLNPQWGQDLAFFHQWVHSAANGGPWASPLILEPQGFFNQVHTHLVLPLVVAVYSAVPTQNTLLVAHSLFAALAIWPAFRLAELAGGVRYALLFTGALVLFGPFQAVAIADFRPVALFIPGLLGVWYGARKGSPSTVLAWSAVALVGRQEATYLLAASGGAILLLPWAQSKRRTIGWALIAIGSASWAGFALLKPEMFFHINPMAPTAWPEGAELWQNRLGFATALGLSAWWIGALSPAPLLAATPVFWGMLTTAREWHLLVGPGAHHHAFWLPFVVAAAAVGAARLPKLLGVLCLIIGSAWSFSAPTLTEPNPSLATLLDGIPAEAKVAADYDTIHGVAGRRVLWNVEQLYMPDKPRHWTDPWPLTLSAVDLVVVNKDHPITDRLSDWTIQGETASHAVFTRP